MPHLQRDAGCDIIFAKASASCESETDRGAAADFERSESYAGNEKTDTEEVDRGG